MRRRNEEEGVRRGGGEEGGGWRLEVGVHRLRMAAEKRSTSPSLKSPKSWQRWGRREEEG